MLRSLGIIRRRASNVFIRKSHGGGLYVSDEDLEYDFLYCETCGDSDRWMGEFETEGELKGLLLENDCLEYYSPVYIQSFVSGWKGGA